jgi:hypothetical protein
MAISYSGEGYKFNPQFANLGALQGLQPLDVTRKAEFQLQPLTYAPIPSSRPELVSEGISKGILAAVGGITEGITAKYSAEQKREEKLAERAHDLKVAALKAKQYDPYIEALKTKKLELETDAINKRIEGSVPAGATRRIYKTIDTEPLPESTESTDDKINFNLNPSGLETTSMQENDMSANIAEQSKALEDISAKYLTASTDSGIGSIAPIEPVKSMQLGKVSTSLISPEQEKEIQSKFEPYGIPSVIEKTPPKTLLSIEKAQPKEEVKIEMPESGDVDTEEQAQQMAYREIPGFKEGEYTQEVDENGNPFFRVKPRVKMSKQEIANERKAIADAQKAEIDLTSQGKKQGKTLLDSQINKIIALKSAAEDLNSIETRLNNIPEQFRGPVGGFLAGKNPYSAEIQALNSQVVQIVPGLARGVFGEVGVLNDADIERYTRTIPDIKKDPKVAQQIIKELREKLKRSENNTVSGYEKSGFDVSGFKEGYFEPQKTSVETKQQDTESTRTQMIDIATQLRRETDTAKKQQLEKQYNDLRMSLQSK